jgi:hypothetical protein
MRFAISGENRTHDFKSAAGHSDLRTAQTCFFKLAFLNVVQFRTSVFTKQKIISKHQQQDGISAVKKLP